MGFRIAFEILFVGIAFSCDLVCYFAIFSSELRTLLKQYICGCAFDSFSLQSVG